MERTDHPTGECPRRKVPFSCTLVCPRVHFRGAHVFDFRNGKITRWTSYADSALFNEAHQT